MSWQLAAFAIVLVTLGGAFWWYERSQPPAKLLALVGALAALAALGRDAFAAVPDVKPITAIVLVTGVAFGAAPGFATGALGALASNVLLGEGPWTPWQMLGWGIVGLLGAALGALAGRRLSPLMIALACAAAAEVFNLLLDFYTWTGTGSHTLAGFGLVLGSALAFDVTHVVASFVFGLAFGAVLLRMLLRVRSRMHVTWSAPAIGVLLVAVAVVAGARRLRGARAGGAQRLARRVAGERVSRARTEPRRRLRERARAVDQRAVHGLGGDRPGRRRPQPRRLLRDGHSVLDALRAEAGSLQGAGDLERTILALRACGASVHSLPGGDPTARLLADQGSDGSFEHLTNLTEFGDLRPARRRAARRLAAGAGRGALAGGPAGARRRLRLRRTARRRGRESDVDDTGAAIQALVAAGIHGRAIARAEGYLRERPGTRRRLSPAARRGLQRPVHGLGGAGSRRGGHQRGPRAPRRERLAAGIPGRPDGASGSVRYSRTSSQTPVWVTAQVLAALAAKTLPVAPPPASSRPPYATCGPRAPRRRAEPNEAHAPLPAHPCAWDHHGRPGQRHRPRARGAGGADALAAGGRPPRERPSAPLGGVCTRLRALSRL